MVGPGLVLGLGMDVALVKKFGRVVARLLRLQLLGDELRALFDAFLVDSDVFGS